MICKRCSAEFKTKAKDICSKCRDELFYDTIRSTIVSIFQESKKNVAVIRYLSGRHRNITQGFNAKWTKLYSRKALESIKKNCHGFKGESKPYDKILRTSNCTLDHFRAGKSVLSELVYLYDEGKINTNEDVKSMLNFLFVLNCITKDENKKLVPVQNSRDRGFQTYEEYAEVLGSDLIHFDGSLITQEEIQKYFC